MLNAIFEKRKLFTVAMLASYVFTMSTPAALAVTTTKSPAKKAAVTKPALRSANNTPAFTEMKLEGAILLTKGNPKISLSLRDSEVQQVLRMFADKAGLNIVFNGEISKKVTLDLVDVPLNDAFKLVMQVSGLTYFIDKNTMVVADAGSDLNIAKQEMISIPVKYVNAGKVAEFLNKNIYSLNRPGLSGKDIAITNPATNEVLIFGNKNDALIAQKVIAKLDVKPTSTTFVVNHTTPKEMANLICETLLPAGGSKTSKSSASESNSSDKIAIGEGLVACSIDSSVTAGSLSSFESQNLSVVFFPQRGTISVMGGAPQQINLIKEFIAKNDIKQPQAYLEISMIELSENGSRQFSNNWQVLTKFFSGTFASDTTSTLPYYPTFIKGDSYDVLDPENPDPESPVATFSKFAGSPTITWTMNYMIKNGKGRYLANPKILITNGQKSTIDMTSDYIKTTDAQVLSGTGALAGAVQRTYDIGDDNGIKIEMVPFISPDGYVTLNIKPDYATIKSQQKSMSDDGYEIIEATLLQRTNLDLKNVRIKDGETLVIGGMITENESKSVGKIPFLGDIPGIGVIFRSTSTDKSREELVLMITPKIIKDTEDVVKTSSESENL